MPVDPAALVDEDGGQVRVPEEAAAELRSVEAGARLCGVVAQRGQDHWHEGAGLGAKLAVSDVEEVRTTGHLAERLPRVDVGDGVVGVAGRTRFSIEREDSMSTLTREFSIDGMHCAGCVKSVIGAVSRVPGVKHVEVSLEKNAAKVEAKGI